MRKLYCRRLFLPLFLLSILSMCFLVFHTISHNKHENFISPIYDTQISCPDIPKTSLMQLPTVPPQHLVIPYREFVLRTAIACRAFKLDNPQKDPTNFHPKYSKYLRGRFPHVIPHVNITFEDIENFYTKPLINQKNASLVTDTPFAQNITLENIPYKFQDGMWQPVGITSAQRTAILIPLQGREYNAKAFLLNMHAFLRRQQLTYTIVLIEQVSPLGRRFNKGRLFNTAIQYLQKQSLNITCLILHDVDLLPEDDGNLYTCESKYPKHTTSRVQQIGSTHGYTRFYEFLIGGVLLLTFDMYKTLNGFSNLYWGWGGEDDDFALRLIANRMCIVRPSYELAIYIGKLMKYLADGGVAELFFVGLPHPRGQRNNARFGLLTWATLRYPTDGYAQIESLTRIVSVRQTSTVIHLKLDVDVVGSVHKPASMDKSSSSLNKTDVHVSSIDKMLVKTTVTTRKPF